MTVAPLALLPTIYIKRYVNNILKKYKTANILAVCYMDFIPLMPGAVCLEFCIQCHWCCLGIPVLYSY